MKRLMIAALTLPLAGAAFAQDAGVANYTEVDDVRIVGQDGERVGEIEGVLLDGSGKPAAYVVEVEDGFLDLGDTEVVIGIDDLTWDAGRYTTSMSEDQMKALPVWDD